MEKPATGLAALAENRAVVVAAYLAAFFPWALMYAHDFISSRWRTVGETRRTGYWHLITACFSLGYVVFYAHIQNVAKEYTEMSVAIVAIMLTLVHMARTVWGHLQLQAFRAWCLRAYTCIDHMGL